MQRLIRLKAILPVLLLFILLNSCANITVVDVNVEVPEHSWMYAKSIKTKIEIKDSTAAYNVYFKIRNTADYRYSNIYVVMHLRGKGLAKNIRFQYKLAKNEGEWIGKGSGDLFSNHFPMLTNYRFAKAGTYEIEIEQNMRDNPLVGISDVGVVVEKNP